MSSQKAKQNLARKAYPVIPEKLYFTIGEASRLCLVKPHVLRYWEQEFSQLKPVKRRGNRRYYQRADILLVRQIIQLLYERGYTIEGARQQLATKPQSVAGSSAASLPTEKVSAAVTDLEALLGELEDA